MKELLMTLFAIGCLTTMAQQEETVEPPPPVNNRRAVNEAPAAVPYSDPLKSVRFGFTDKSGKQLLMLNEEDGYTPVLFKQAFITGATAKASISYEEEQQASKSDNGRHTAANFANCQGVRFTLQTPTQPDASAIIPFYDFLVTRKPIPFHTTQSQKPPPHPH